MYICTPWLKISLYYACLVQCVDFVCVHVYISTGWFIVDVNCIIINTELLIMHCLYIPDQLNTSMKVVLYLLRVNLCLPTKTQVYKSCIILYPFLLYPAARLVVETGPRLTTPTPTSLLSSIRMH